MLSNKFALLAKKMYDARPRVSYWTDGSRGVAFVLPNDGSVDETILIGKHFEEFTPLRVRPPKVKIPIRIGKIMDTLDIASQLGFSETISLGVSLDSNGKVFALSIEGEVGFEKGKIFIAGG